MQGGEGEGKPFPILGSQELIDVDGVNRLIACLIATTVAKWFPASREARQEDVGHGASPSPGAIIISPDQRE